MENEAEKQRLMELDRELAKETAEMFLGKRTCYTNRWPEEMQGVLEKQGLPICGIKKKTQPNKEDVLKIPPNKAFKVI